MSRFSDEVDRLGITMVMSDDGWKVASHDAGWVADMLYAFGVTLDAFERAYNGTERRFPDILGLPPFSELG